MMMPIENVHVVMKLVQPVSALSLSIIALLVLLLLEIISIWTEFLSLAHKPVLKVNYLIFKKNKIIYYSLIIA
jgi:hypothetical protein